MRVKVTLRRATDAEWVAPILDYLELHPRVENESGTLITCWPNKDQYGRLLAELGDHPRIGIVPRGLDAEV